MKNPPIFLTSRQNPTVVATAKLHDKKYRTESYDGEITFPNYIKIDNSNLAPDVVAKMIKERFGL